MAENYQFLDALEHCAATIRGQIVNPNAEEAKTITQAAFGTLFLALADAHSPATAKVARFILNDYYEVMKRG